MKNKNPKLTIGMCTYDDFDGTYFSFQSIRLYQPEVLNDVEFLLIDNNPEGKQGKELKRFFKESMPNGKYIPFTEYTGCGVRTKLFEYASAPAVLCMDCHVMLNPGSLSRLIKYYDDNPETEDLLHGPLLWEQLENTLKLKNGKEVPNISTHFDTEWRNGMRGRWANYESLGYDVDDPPFEIPAHGMGLFSSRKDSWLGFNEYFREFGGEEVYIHEKYRQQGRKVLCLPFLRWVHRFYRPGGPPYPLTNNMKIRNYFIGHMELKIPLDDMVNHFVDEKTITWDGARELLKDTMKETGYIPLFKDKEVLEKMNPYRRTTVEL